MQATLENLGTLERRLNVSVPQAEIEAEVQTRLKNLARTARVHGFRPGKVPLRVMAQQYGDQVRQEVLGEVLQRSFTEAVMAQKLRVAGFPRFEPKPAAEGASQFEYSAVFEIYPEVKVGDFSQATIERPVLEVAPADVERTVEILRRQRAAYVPAARGAQNGDRVTLDFDGTVDGAPFAGGKGEGVVLLLGDGRLLPDFERQVIGLTQGESREFELTFPADYHGHEVAGKQARFKVTAKAVDAAVLPPVDAEFAKSLGVEDGDLDKMRAEIKANLEREVKRRVQARVKEQALKVLLETAQLEEPRALVDAEIQSLSAGMQKAGPVTVPIGHLIEEQARRRVRLGLVLAELVKQNDLHAKPEQVRAVVEEYAQSYEQPQEVVAWHYAAPERLREAEALALEDNVVGWVQARAKMVDQAVSFEDFMERA